MSETKVYSSISNERTLIKAVNVFVSSQREKGYLFVSACKQHLERHYRAKLIFVAFRLNYFFFIPTYISLFLHSFVCVFFMIFF